ncbi:MAG: 30S ribosomal protein S4 [Candidatus Vogelbacteria bacterium CG10_big_fil_rev_8_21_14_0_10_51_16]|uniref:Small ribosomal subunit protein uS4 n=1 Tax=Candidatus Vogelbacteria bacterium CG10_big_fil_rev_8_21_14_0_10_51_16 TaxID=1975045 RepID=A0A2H0RFN6_9BACT|nr:MAG: 30S ribosomal protein S4 [Candidatus Vogelbacteria bacterium CG10_big_fil_rev_8_21_14_0_10_51_16]
MIRKPQYKTARKFGEAIFPKTQTQKFAVRMGRKSIKRGRRRSQKTEYGEQLLAKQRVKLTYGVLEKQFARYVSEARERDRLNPVANLFTRLETRLDNVVFRTGLAPSRAAARQMVGHGHIVVNGHKVSTPSYNVEMGDTIELHNSSKQKTQFQEISQRLKNNKAPVWLQVNNEKVLAMIASIPTNHKEEPSLNFEAVLELYSRA